MQTVTVPQPLPMGLQAAVAQAGHVLIYMDGNWVADDAAAVSALITNYSPLAATQAAAIAQVEAQLAAKMAAGFTYNGVLIGIGQADIININAMGSTAMVTLQAAALNATVPAWPANFAWLPQGEGASLPLTAQEMLSFAAAVSHYVSALILYQDILVEQIKAATTVAAVNAVLAGASWPSS